MITETDTAPDNDGYIRCQMMDTTTATWAEPSDGRCTRPELPIEFPIPPVRMEVQW